MKFALMALSAGLAACGTFPTTVGFEQAMNSYMGGSVADLVGRLGPPQNEYTLPDGTKILSYTRTSSMELGGYTHTVPVTSNTTGTIGNGLRSTNYSATTTTYQQVQAPVTNVALWCTVNFTVSGPGMVMRWQSNGNNCVAHER